MTRKDKEFALALLAQARSALANALALTDTPKAFVLGINAQERMRAFAAALEKCRDSHD